VALSKAFDIVLVIIISKNAQILATAQLHKLKEKRKCYLRSPGTNPSQKVIEYARNTSSAFLCVKNV
jgi:hypothetical protein